MVYMPEHGDNRRRGETQDRPGLFNVSLRLYLAEAVQLHTASRLDFGSVEVDFLVEVAMTPMTSASL